MSNEKDMKTAFDFFNIDSDYYDAMGGHHTLSHDYKVKFLNIFGLKENNIQEELEKLQNKVWLTPLEPIYVIRENKSEFRIYFYEKVNFDYNQAQLYINKTPYPISWPGKSSEYRLIGKDIYHKHYFDIPHLDIGYHSLELVINNKKHKSTLVIAPEFSYLPEDIENGKNIGIACHLYSLHSKNSQGIGDFSDLSKILKKTKTAGGDILLTQPSHYTSILTDDNQSPYYPLSRLFLNPLYIDLKQLGIKIKNNLNLGSYVDYNQVIEYKIPLLKKYFKKFTSDKSFIQFKKSNKMLESFACFCTLYEKHDKISWRDWPKEYQKPNTKAIKEFISKNKSEIDFHKFLQYIAFQQLEDNYKLTQELNMSIGLCNDLALGAGHHSFEAWYYSKSFVFDAEVGAPPDEMNIQGQSWGFPPYNPIELRKSAYKVYIDLLKKNMKHFGAIRIDHAMHILRLYWNISKKHNDMIGSYVYYNIDEILGIIALESHLNKCIVIAEDLGTVAEGFRERLKEEKILTTKELYFELDENRDFKNPEEEYEKLSISTIHTHDTATVEGYIRNHDLDIQYNLGILNKSQYKSEKLARQTAIKHLLEKHNTNDKKELKSIFNNMIINSKSCISLLYIDDFTDELEQLNLPGTTHEHRNWSHKLSKSLEEIEIKFEKKLDKF
ncbi:MAG: 4-alpha-glucanotransferase [Alphaproteobacteria bacterium]|jgi:4-alpha-glucanotransferase|nr:4-alpha-glucanotransferase [Alphaproteobacteria bacterium]